jgi:hypothetical protein
MLHIFLLYYVFFFSLSIIIVTYVAFCVFCLILLLCIQFVCKCVLYYCHWKSTQLQLNIPYIYIYNTLHLFAICHSGGDLLPYVSATNEGTLYNWAKKPNSAQVSSLRNQYSGPLQDDSSGRPRIHMKRSGKKRETADWSMLGSVFCNSRLYRQKSCYICTSSSCML